MSYALGVMILFNRITVEIYCKFLSDFFKKNTYI